VGRAGGPADHRAGVQGAAAALVIPQIEGAGDPAARPAGAAAGSGRRGAVEAKPE